MEQEIISPQKKLQDLVQENQQLTQENKLLREKVDFLIRRLFGKKSERFDSSQMFLDGIMGIHSQSAVQKHTEEASLESKRKNPRKKKVLTPNLPKNLITDETIVIPKEVEVNPDQYRCIGEEREEQLDVITQRYIKKLTIYKKFVSIENPYNPPIIAPRHPRLIERSIATPGLLTSIILGKYQDHLPLHRQEQILKERYGIYISRKTMSDWVQVIAMQWLQVIYNEMKQELLESPYLQVDETPVKYQAKNKCQEGRLWAYRDPRGNVLFNWKTSRSHECLNEVLEGYNGAIHSDAFSAYYCFARKNPHIILLICFAHARRLFFEAKESHSKIASWFLRQIGLLYDIERTLKKQRAGPKFKESIRQSQSQMILKRIHQALTLKLNRYLPKEKMGKALQYALNHWEGLQKYIYHGHAEIDNNLVEGAIRPTAIGKKNWTFIGHPEAVQKSAILYSIIASCRAYGINTSEYFNDVLNRLPTMTNQEAKKLTPKKWSSNKAQAVA